MPFIFLLYGMIKIACIRSKEAYRASMPIEISIVIPAYNVASYIRDCLEAVRRQTLDACRFEVIVIDDGSTDHTLALLQQLKAEWAFDGLNIVHQPNGGPAAARNRGVALARAPIVVFLDSDCIAEPQWLEALTRPLFENPALVGVEGKTLPASEKRTLMDHYVSNAHGGFCWTCNMAYRRDILLRLGGLDEGFPWPSGEDIDLAHRVKQVGEIPFVPDALVYHLILKRRFLKHLAMARCFSTMLRLQRKHPGLLTKMPGFLGLVCFQMVQLLGPIVTQRRELPKAPVAYLQFCLVQSLMALDTLMRLPAYYGEYHQPLVIREPLQSLEEIQAKEAS